MEKSISGAGLSVTGSKKSISHRSEKEAIALAVMNLSPPKHSTTTSDLVNYIDEYEPQRTDLDVSGVMVLAQSPRLDIDPPPKPPQMDAAFKR